MSEVDLKALDLDGVRRRIVYVCDGASTPNDGAFILRAWDTVVDALRSAAVQPDAESTDELAPSSLVGSALPDGLDLDALERLAKAASDEPWTWEFDQGQNDAIYEPPHIVVATLRGDIVCDTWDVRIDGTHGELANEQTWTEAKADAAFIAAADPPTVLALIAAIREAKLKEATDEGSDAASLRDATRLPDAETRAVLVERPEGLHIQTFALVIGFAKALAEKLRAAEVKYGYEDGWSDPSWMDGCRAKLRAHLEKGDPRDVAAYCAFLWYHGASTKGTATEVAEERASATQPNPVTQTPTADGREALVAYLRAEGKQFGELFEPPNPFEAWASLIERSVALDDEDRKALVRHLPGWVTSPENKLPRAFFSDLDASIIQQHADRKRLRSILSRASERDSVAETKDVAALRETPSLPSDAVVDAVRREAFILEAVEHRGFTRERAASGFDNRESRRLGDGRVFTKDILDELVASRYDVGYTIRAYQAVVATGVADERERVTLSSTDREGTQVTQSAARPSSDSVEADGERS